MSLFVYYCKIVNILLKNDIYILKQITKKLKYGIEILVGPAFLSYGSKQSKFYFEQ